MTTPVPLLTIITAVKNPGVSLSDTIDSIENLAYENLEYIVVDGASVDGTLQLVDDRRDLVTQYIREPDAGIYDAMNKGWRAASEKGNILFLGAGDRIVNLPENMQRLNSGCVLYGNVWLGGRHLFRSRATRQLKFANTLHHQALIIPKRLHPDPPFNPSYRVYADFDFNQRLYQRGGCFLFDDKFVSYALPGGLSRTYSCESYRISKRNFGIFWGAVSWLFFGYSRLRGKLRRGL